MEIENKYHLIQVRSLKASAYLMLAQTKINAETKNYFPASYLKVSKQHKSIDRIKKVRKNQ